MSTEDSSRRRRPASAAATKTEAAPKVVAETAAKTEKKPRPPRVETVPVPDDLVGKSLIGRISDVIRVGVPKSRPAYGFINLGDNVESVENIPRIYFKRSEYSDETHFIPRRGFQVSFLVSKVDDKFYATNVKLTTAGKAEADISKAKADETKAAKAAAAPAAAATSAPAASSAATTTPAAKKEANNTKKEAPAKTDKPVRAKKPRKIDETVIKLNVTLEGSQDTHAVDVKIGRALGPLKRDVIKAFEATGDFVINHVTNENPAGTFLTMAILKTLKDGDRLHFAKAPEKAAA